MAEQPIFIPKIFDGRRYCVYGHYLGSVLFYIGSGQISRAFEFEPTRRNPAWQFISARREIDVVLLHRVRTRDEARRLEYAAIGRWKPFGNETLEEDQPRDFRIINTQGATVAVLVDRVTVVRCLPSGWEYRTVKEASYALGVSKSAIYNSLSGRYPDVRGMRFERVDGLYPKINGDVVE